MKLVKCSGSVLNSSGMSGTGTKVWLVILQTSSVKQGKFWFNCCSTARVKSSPKSLKMNLCLKQVLDYFSHKWTFPCCYFVAYSGKEIREQRSARGHIMFSERWLPHRPLRNSSIFFFFLPAFKESSSGRDIGHHKHMGEKLPGSSELQATSNTLERTSYCRKGRWK